MMPMQYIQGAATGFQGYREQAVVAVHSDGTAAIVFAQLASDFRLELVSTVVPKSTKRLNFSGITPTWGSGTSESVAAAVQKACEAIAQSLSPYKSEGSWKAMVTKAAA